LLKSGDVLVDGGGEAAEASGGEDVALIDGGTVDAAVVVGGRVLGVVARTSLANDDALIDEAVFEPSSPQAPSKTRAKTASRQRIPRRIMPVMERHIKWRRAEP
jgi:hypothetical protein